MSRAGVAGAGLGGPGEAGYSLGPRFSRSPGRLPPMPDDLSSLDQARRRLETALARLEEKVRATPAPPRIDPRAEGERQRLEGELRGARTRERQLEQVAAEASAALGRAAAEVRAALEAEV